MAKSKLRRRGKPYDPAAKVHDRRSNDLLRNANVGVIEIDDPFELGGKLLAFRNIRNDPLARLHDRRQIDEAQFQAGRAFQHDWETAERGPQAIDPSKEAVDGGRMPEPITEAQQAAAKRLNAVQRDLGIQGAALAKLVLISGLTMDQVAEVHRVTGDQWRRHFSAILRMCLDTLALAYGFASRNSSSSRSILADRSSSITCNSE